MRDHQALDHVFAEHPIDAVIHFAAKKAVGESMQIPLEYFDINLAGTTNLLRTMHEHDVRKLVFSSSCSIYGDQYAAPITEEDLPAPTNPYARSKLMCEQILADTCTRYPELSMIALRYFNPVGGHPSGRLGEDPHGVPNNVMPYMMQVAVGRLEKLTVFGTDYDTLDGSGVRDYIHVMDVAEAHCVAMDHLADATTAHPQHGHRGRGLGAATPRDVPGSVRRDHALPDRGAAAGGRWHAHRRPQPGGKGMGLADHPGSAGHVRGRMAFPESSPNGLPRLALIAFPCFRAKE